MDTTKLNYKRTILIGFAFMSISAFWQLYDNIVPLILKNTFSIGDTISGAIMALDNVFAVVLLPVFGALSDKVKTPLGKRIPFIIVGTVLAIIAMIFMPIADNGIVLWGFIAALFFTLISMSTYRSPAVALMPDVTPKNLRSKANAIINLMGALGGVITLALVAVLVPKEGKPNYLPLFAIIAGIMAVSVAIVALTIKENKLVREMELCGGYGEPDPQPAKEQKGRKLPKDVMRSLIFILMSVFLWFMAYNAVNTAFSKYAQEVFGLIGGSFALTMMIATVSAVITYIPAGIVASKIGRKKTILGGVILLSVAFGGAFFFTSYSPLIPVLLAIAGIGWASINVNSYPMVVEMAKGNDVGKYTGYYYTFSMAAQIITPILSGALLEHVSYRTLFPYAVTFSVLAFVTMSFVKHGDSKPGSPKSKLEMLDVDAD
ncbi:MAG: MFS transporter [Oscillospiraceae bacterium]|nr:MFS transporter [Oscillospiraceae bacterium]